MDELEKLKSRIGELEEQLRTTLSAQSILYSYILRTFQTGRSEKPVGVVCSFCGKAQAQVRKLVLGHGSNICDECHALCIEILESETDSQEQEVPTPKEDQPSKLEKPDPPLTCSFCGKTSTNSERLISGPGVNICSDCVQLTSEILSEF